MHQQIRKVSLEKNSQTKEMTPNMVNLKILIYGI